MSITEFFEYMRETLDDMREISRDSQDIGSKIAIAELARQVEANLNTVEASKPAWIRVNYEESS